MSMWVFIERLRGDRSHDVPTCSRGQGTTPKRDARCSNLRERRVREGDLEQTANEHEDSKDGDNRVEAH